MIPEIDLPPTLEYALRIRHTYRAGWEQWFLLVSDLHWDSPECYLRLVHQHYSEAKERQALIINTGDLFDAISGRDDPRGSKGTLMEEHVGVNYLDRLVDAATEEFRPYADQLMYEGTGNHEQNLLIRRETDLTARWIERMNALRSPGLPRIHRAGYTGWIRFLFQQANESKRLSLAMKVEHGTGGNSPVTKGVIQTARRGTRTEGATFFVSGHIHEQWELTDVVERLNSSTSRIELRQRKHIQLGSYKADFRVDGAGTWAMQKSGTPKPIGGKWLRFYSPTSDCVRWQVMDTDVDYSKLGDMVRKPKGAVA